MGVGLMGASLACWMAFMVGASSGVQVNCAENVGAYRGLHAHYAGGFAGYADPAKLKPLLDPIGADTLRFWLLDGQDYFKGTTIEDAQNPELYDFEQIDYRASQPFKLGMETFAVLASVPPSLHAPDKPYGGPVNYDVYGEVIKRIVMRVTQGWAGGPKLPIRYFEVGNEPDLTVLGGAHWTPEEYFQTYEAGARAIKSLTPPDGHPGYLVGGPALAGFEGDFADNFLKYCNDHDVPLDFFSFHVYADDPGAFEWAIAHAQELLAKYPKLKDTKLILDEWNAGLEPDFSLVEGLKPEEGERIREFVVGITSHPKFSKPENGIHLARCLMIMERSALAMGGRFLLADDGKVQMGLIVCPDSYLPGFVPGPPKLEPGASREYRTKPAYQVMRAFELFSETPQLVRVKAFGEVDALAGISADGNALQVLLVNWGAAKTLPVSLSDLPWSGDFEWTQRTLELREGVAQYDLDETTRGKNGGGSFKESLEVPAHGVSLIRLVTTR